MDKDEVLRVAMHAYWVDGPATVSLNSVCQRAGVSKPSVYREFTNEDGLTCAALETYADQVLGRVLAVLQGGDTVAQKVEQIAALAARDAQHTNGCLFVKMRAARPEMGEKTQALIDQVDQMALQGFAQLLQDARASGAWAGDVPVALGAQYLHAQIGLALDQRARGQDPTDMLAMALSVFRFNPA